MAPELGWDDAEVAAQIDTAGSAEGSRGVEGLRLPRARAEPA